MKFPEYIGIGRCFTGKLTALKFEHVIDEKRASYYRVAGNWSGTAISKEDNKLIFKIDNIGEPLNCVEITREEWLKDNKGYVKDSHTGEGVEENIEDDIPF